MTTTHDARIEISTLCNYRCVFCPHHFDFKRKKEIMSNNLFDIIIDKIKKIESINMVTLSGMGESLLDNEIIYKIKKAKSMGYKVCTLTNGALLSKKLIDEFILNGIDSIRLSLHTLDITQYKKITGSNKHSHVLEMIEYLIEKKDNIELIITCDIIDINEDNIQNLINTYSNRIDLLEIWKPHNWVNWKNYRNSNKKKKTCGRPFNGPLQIQVDGTMNMCCFDYNGKLLIGDLKTQTINEIFRTYEYECIKNAHLNGNLKGFICENCDQLYESDPNIVIYNSKFSAEDRIKRTSTQYEDLNKSYKKY